MTHEESFRLRCAIGRDAGFVQGLPVSTRHHQLCGVAVLPFSVEPTHGRRGTGLTGIEPTYETARGWATKFGLTIAKRIRSRRRGAATGGTSKKWS